MQERKQNCSMAISSIFFLKENGYPTRKDGSKTVYLVNSKHVLSVCYLRVFLGTAAGGGGSRNLKEFMVRGEDGLLKVTKQCGRITTKKKKMKKTDRPKDMNRPFTREDLQVANKHAKVLNFISHQGNANSNHDAMLLDMHQNG